jgi:hypothetical protein
MPVTAPPCPRHDGVDASLETALAGLPRRRINNYKEGIWFSAQRTLPNVSLSFTPGGNAIQSTQCFLASTRDGYGLRSMQWLNLIYGPALPIAERLDARKPHAGDFERLKESSWWRPLRWETPMFMEWGGVTIAPADVLYWMRVKEPPLTDEFRTDAQIVARFSPEHQRQLREAMSR